MLAGDTTWMQVRHGCAARRPSRRTAVAFVGLALAAACAPPPPAPQAHRAAMHAHADDRAVHVVRRGWHTGIVIDLATPGARALPPDLGSAAGGGQAEFGWGDRAFYMADDPSVWLAARAALAPTPAVLHVMPVTGPPFAGADDVVSFSLSGPRFAALAQAIADSLDPDGAAAPLATGVRERGVFFAARGAFHLQNTCNTWVARTLAAAGLAIDPDGVVTAGAAMRGLRAALAAEDQATARPPVGALSDGAP
jgi:uncharacterized protein (TIGR02117 family)